MPCHTRMKRIMQGLLWLFFLEFGCSLMVTSLEPGYLDFDNLPDTNFSCVGKVIGGYYADLETNCQMFHVCTIGQLDEPMDIRFLCLNGTVFDQETRVCERIDEVDCSKSEQFYSLNLELYGNTQPPILEEDFPVEIKRSSSTTTTTTTTTQRPSHQKVTSQPYYTTSVPPTTTRPATKVITSHHFPVVNSPDIRFNPEEINISLNPGSPPDITRSQVPISFQQQSYSNSERNTRVTVTTHTTIYKNDKPHRVPLLPTANTPSQIFVEHENVESPHIVETTQTPKSVVSYGLTHNQGLQAATPTEINYGFTYQQTEENLEYNTEVPPHPYQYQISIANLRPPTAQEHPYHSYQTTSKRPHKVNFPVPTTYRNHPAYTSVRASQEFHSQRTEKPPRLQLPLPLLPTLPPLTFSSPAPFSLGRHIETKRYTNDHQSPPRIIISASASVSDNSGRRLNYSLGTIGASHLLGRSPATYDEYKEDDVGLDPFYHDVPKIKSLRHKRSAEEDVIKNDEEAADLLKYLFNWYSKRAKARKISIPVTSEDITEINEELAPIVEASTEEDYSNMFVDKTNKENVTEPNNLEAASVKQEVQLETRNNTNNILEELAKMLEILNKTNNFTTNFENSEQMHDLKEETKHSEVFELPRHVDNTLNKTDIHVNVEQVPVPSAKPKKPKQGRNNRRRTGKSRNTPRRTKKPKSHRKANHPHSSNSTRAHEGSGDGSQLNKSYNVSEISSSNVRKNSSRSGRPRKTNTAVENLEIPKPVLLTLVEINKNEQNVHKIDIKQSKNLEDQESRNSTTTPETKTVPDSEHGHTTLGNISELSTEEAVESTTITEKIKHKDLSKIYKLLGEPESVISPLPHFDPKSPENDTEEVVETHESKQLEHIIATHDNLQFFQPENTSTETVFSENTTTEDTVTENTTLEVINSEKTTPENITSENATFENTNSENTTPENTNSQNTTPSENTTPENTKSENTTLESTTPENSTTEHDIPENDKLRDLKVEEHSTEIVYENTKKQIQDDEIQITTTSDPEYVSTTLEPGHEDLQAKPSSYRNEGNFYEVGENDEVQPTDHDEVVLSEVNKQLEKLSENDGTYKPNYVSEYGDYENETEAPKDVEASTEYLKEENDKAINLYRTDKTLEEQELEGATLHIDLLNSENNPEINDEKELTDLTSEALKEEEIYEVVQTTENLEIDTTTWQPELTTIQEHRDDEHSYVKNKNIALTSRHRTRERLVLPQLRYLNHDEISDTEHQHEENKNQTKKPGRINFNIANRRTYEVESSEEGLSNSPKLSAISLYKSRAEGEKRRNNYIRNRKFIANPSPSKNIENPEVVKTQQKEKHESSVKSNLKEENSEITKIGHEEHHESEFHEKDSPTEENSTIPDYVDDNYEPLTYQESPKIKEFEHLATTTYRDQDLEENTVTDELQHLNSLEHSTDFSELSDLHDHTSARSNEDEEIQITTTSGSHEEINANYEDKVQTTPMIQDDVVIGTTDATYEILTEATTATGSLEQFPMEAYLKNVDEEHTTEPPTTHLTTLTVEITTLPTTTEVEGAIHSLETTTEPATTITAPETTTNSPLLSEYVQTTNANTESTIDWVQGPIFTTDYPTEGTTLNLETTQATSVAPSSTSDSSSRITSLTEPEEQIDITTPMGDGTTNKYQHLKTRLPWYKRQDNAKRKAHARHRFSTNSRRIGTTGLRERNKLENKITHVLNNLNRSNSNSRISSDKLLVDRYRNVNNNNTAKLSDIESVVNSNTTNINNSSSNILEHNLNETKIEQPHPPEVATVKTPAVTTIKTPEVATTIIPEIPSEITTINFAESIETTITPEEQQPTTLPTELERSSSGEIKLETPVTDAPLLKSANPTKAKYTKIVFTTTPLSKFVRVELRKDMHGRRYSFNCFNKKVHQFYSDARDCRLFHYCTLGYTKNQMVDMKFVCDAGTYFDDVKLICTKVKPARCL